MGDVFTMIPFEVRKTCVNSDLMHDSRQDERLQDIALPLQLFPEEIQEILTT